VQKSLSQFYYSDWMMIAITFAAFIVSLRQDRNVNGLRFISYYIIAALITDFFSIYLYFSHSPNERLDRSQASPETIFSFFEIVFFYIFFYRNIKVKTSRRITLWIFTFYCFFVICCGLLWHQNILHLPRQFLGVQAICLVIPSLFYFHELFNSNYNIKIKNHPPFWVALGILICNSLSAPICILGSLVPTNFSSDFNILDSINYILYSLLFLLLMKAYLCLQQTK
jgi:hypothetical protein